MCVSYIIQQWDPCLVVINQPIAYTVISVLELLTLPCHPPLYRMGQVGRSHTSLIRKIGLKWYWINFFDASWDVRALVSEKWGGRNCLFTFASLKPLNPYLFSVKICGFAEPHADGSLIVFWLLNIYVGPGGTGAFDTSTRTRSSF